MSTNSGGKSDSSVDMSASKSESWNEIMDKENTGGAVKGGLLDKVTPKKSFAAVLGGNLPKRDDKNVLEVVLEKEERGSFSVTETECVRLIRKLGLDVRPGVQVEGVQLCPQGRGVIFITLKDCIEISRFCRHDVVQVTETGIRAIMVKAAGKREVVVTARGVHPNTKDEAVVDYLGKFGKVTTSMVVYGQYKEGPLQGFRNGDRSYKVEINPGTNLGSYHAIDGHKVSMRYPGQQQTCARCHKTPQHCRGRGVARRCEAEGGLKVEFTDYILDLWSKIGYSPTNTIVSDLDPEVTKVTEHEGCSFTPVKTVQVDEEKFTGVSIRQIPKGTDHGDIMDLLGGCGLPEEKKNNVKINNNGSVIITGLNSKESLLLIENIQGKKHFGKKIFCNGYLSLTPEKSESSPPNPTPATTSGDLITPSETLATATLSGEPLAPFENESSAIPFLHVSQDLQNDQLPGNSSSYTPQIFFPSNDQVVRRHSISLCGRTPPQKSLASEILNHPPHTQSLISKLQDLKDSISDLNSEFNSCNESPDAESSSSEYTENNQKTSWAEQTDKKHLKKKKRKLVSPTKDEILKKKASRQNSPKQPRANDTK